MNANKREARRLAKKQAQLAALLGIEAPAPETKTVSSPRQEAQFLSREAEAVLSYYYTYDGSEWQRRECNQCGRVFAVNRSNVSNCSDKCRKEALAAIGIDWDVTKTAADRWRRGQAANFVGEPLVVPPQVVQIIDELKAEQPLQKVEAVTASAEVAGDSKCTVACLEMHTFESGCELFFDVDEIVV